MNISISQVADTLTPTSSMWHEKDKNSEFSSQSVSADYSPDNAMYQEPTLTTTTLI